MNKSVEEIREYYPENDQDIIDVADNYTWEMSYGWQAKLSLKENIIAHKDRGLNQWFLSLPLEVKESLNLIESEPHIFIEHQFWDQFTDLEDKPTEDQPEEFPVGIEEQQAKLKSKIIKLKDYKNDREE